MIKKLTYLSILTSLIGASVISINVGAFQLSIFRALIIFLTFVLGLNLLFTDGRIYITRRNQNSFSIMVMLIWLIYAGISLIWVKDYGGWIKAIYFLSLGVLCIIIYNKIFKTSYDILLSFRIISIMIVIHNLLGWYEIITGKYMFLANSLEYYARYKYPVSMFGNTNDFATFMLISIFILYVCAVNSKIKLIKLFYITTIVSSICLLIMTTSRANILGLILATAVFIYLSMKDKQRRRGLLLLLTILFGFVLIMPVYYKSLLLMINSILSFDFFNETGSDFTRWHLIKNGFYFLLNTFGFGTGAGNIEYWMENFSKYSTNQITNIHNWWMEILTGYGIIIFILYVTFYIKLFCNLYSIYKMSKNKIETTISLSILCIMAGFVIASISSSSNISKEWLWVFWALVISFQGKCCYLRTKVKQFTCDGRSGN